LPIIAKEAATMRCWNCNKVLAANAKVCVECEAPVLPEPTEEEKAAAQMVLDQLPPEQLAQFLQTMEESESADDFVNQIFVGDCPKCNSSNTGDCEKDPEIDNLLVGRCFDCGQYFCTECSKLLDAKAPECECLDDEDFSDLDDQE
jgi:hypothetical protein